MAIKLVREFKQNQQLSITPQLKKSIDLLQLSRLEIINKLIMRLKRILFLKKILIMNHLGALMEWIFWKNLPNELTLQDHLKNQLLDIEISDVEKIAISNYPVFRREMDYFK